MSKLGNLIREKRRERGLTQAELAKKVGVTDGYIAKIEIGYQQAGLKTLYKLLEALEIPEEEILEYDEGFLSLFSRLADKAGSYDKEFSKLSPKVKGILLRIAPFLEK